MYGTARSRQEDWLPKLSFSSTAIRIVRDDKNQQSDHTILCQMQAVKSLLKASDGMSKAAKFLSLMDPHVVIPR
jgi:hypothetical protein